MIPIEKCRKILEDNGEAYTDKEIQEIREYLYKMVKTALDTKKNSRNEKTNDEGFSLRKS